MRRCASHALAARQVDVHLRRVDRKLLPRGVAGLRVGEDVEVARRRWKEREGGGRERDVLSLSLSLSLSKEEEEEEEEEEEVVASVMELTRV